MKIFRVAIILVSIIALILMGDAFTNNPPKSIVHRVGYICTTIALIAAIFSNLLALMKHENAGKR